MNDHLEKYRNEIKWCFIQAVGTWTIRYIQSIMKHVQKNIFLLLYVIICVYTYGTHTQTSAAGVHVQTDAKRSTHIVCFKDCYMLEKYITLARNISWFMQIICKKVALNLVKRDERRISFEKCLSEGRWANEVSINFRVMQIIYADNFAFERADSDTGSCPSACSHLLFTFWRDVVIIAKCRRITVRRQCNSVRLCT